MPVSFLVSFSGRVQGVFFRATCASIAKKYGIAGFAQNEEGGSVSVLAEGEKENVEKFIQEISALHSNHGIDVKSAKTIEKKEILKKENDSFSVV